MLYPDILSRYTRAEDLLLHVNDHIHEEVKSLNPGAMPPRVDTHADGTDLVVEYRSHRPFAHIAYGLVRGAMRHFDDPRLIAWDVKDPSSRHAIFRIAQRAAAASISSRIVPRSLSAMPRSLRKRDTS